MSTDSTKSGTYPPLLSASSQSYRGFFRRIMPLLVFLFLMSGCAAWQKATASSQNIAPPDETVWTNLMLIRERALVSGETITLTDAAVLYVALGKIEANGPANIKRDAEKTKEGFKLGVETDNSAWIGGMFKGLWSSATTIGDWVVKLAAGAAP